MKKNIYLSVILFVFTVFVSKAQESEKTDAPKFNTFSVEDFKTKFKTNYILLDVRSPEEFNEGHIKGALSMNVNDDDFVSKVKSLSKEKNVFVYCAAGIRSKKASEMLSNMGFQNVYNLSGGYDDLVKAGMPHEK